MAVGRRAVSRAAAEGRARRRRAIEGWWFALGALTRQRSLHLRWRRVWLAGSLAAAFVGAMLSVSSALLFENVADLKFFGTHIPGSGLGYAAWLAAFRTPDSYIVGACDDMDALWGSRVPVLFRGCTRADVPSGELVYFGASTQNLFAPCDTPRRREHTYQPLDGPAQPIVETVPCLNRTLDEKLATYRAHDPAVEPAYYEVHPLLLDGAQERLLAADWHERGLVPPAFRMRGGPFVLTTFLHSGRTAVDYFHSHMDVFLSFCLDGPKTWELINPTYHERFEYRWSGNANVLLREVRRAPRVLITQQRGDILYVPSWWIHKTSATPRSKSYGINLHGMPPGSHLGIAAYFFMRTLGDTEWFFATNRQTQQTFEGAAH